MDEEQVSGCQRLGVGKGVTPKGQLKGIFGGDETVLYLGYGCANTNIHMLKFIELYTKKTKVRCLLIGDYL